MYIGLCEIHDKRGPKTPADLVYPIESRHTKFRINLPVIFINIYF